MEFSRDWNVQYYYPGSSKKEFDELTPCRNQLDGYKKCLAFEEGEFRFCEYEFLHWKKCELENEVNLDVLQKNGIDPSRYKLKCK